MPVLRHFFGLTESDVDAMSVAAIEPYRKLIPHLPPIGAVYMAAPPSKS